MVYRKTFTHYDGEDGKCYALEEVILVDVELGIVVLTKLVKAFLNVWHKVSSV